MKICAHIHLFPPEHCAGSETTLHAALRAMVNRGHSVRVNCRDSKTAPYTVDGIEVVRPPRRGDQKLWLENFANDCDLLVTHLDQTSEAMMLALSLKKPIAHFIHNDAQLLRWRVIPLKAQLIVFNSDWIANKKEAWAYQGEPRLWADADLTNQLYGHSITIHPIVEPQYYRCERGTKITLVNPTPGKGADTFQRLARLMSARQFLAVEGGYGEQILTRKNCGAASSYPNIEWMAHTPEIRNVFRETKVLLMPSDYESYGRVGIEAACAGIPTIAHPTPGLTEAFGDAGIFIDRNDVEAWHRELSRLLTDDVYYRKRSDAVLALADSLSPESEFDRLEQAFIETVERWRKKDEVINVKMWGPVDRRYWETSDGRLVAEIDGRIPSDAIRLAVGIGGLMPEEVAIRNGLIADPDVKAKAIDAPAENKTIEAPQENKAIEAPQENKSIGPKRRGRPKKEIAA
jgi:glycosyltransferase involved in cell wall biosynthesis